MHWTDVLARYGFPADAQVVADLPCAGCGYNLRMSRVGGRCPECARPINDSLTIIHRPELITGALRMMAGTLCVSLVILAIFIPILTFRGRLILIGIALAGSLSYQAMALVDLRFKSALHLHPFAGVWVRRVWSVSLLTSVLILMTGVVWMLLPPGSGAVVPGPSPATLATRNILSLVTLASFLLQLVMMGRLSRDVARMLGYTGIRLAASIQLILVALAPIVFLAIEGLRLSLGATGGATGPGMRTLGNVLLAAVIAGTLLHTVMMLLHLAAAVEEERGMPTDVLDAEPDVLLPAHESPGDHPDIPVG